MDQNKKSGKLSCKRVNLKSTETRARHIYENVKCDICYDDAELVVEIKRAYSAEEFKKNKTGYRICKRVYLCHKHVKELGKLLNFFAEIEN